MHKEISCLVVISDRKRKAELLAALAEKKVLAIHTYYGKGFMRDPAFLDALGISWDAGKVILMGMTAAARVDGILEMLNEDFSFKRPGTGIAFTVRVDSIVF